MITCKMSGIVIEIARPERIWVDDNENVIVPAAVFVKMKTLEHPECIWVGDNEN